jgi:two-component system OmpR family response regulator
MANHRRALVVDDSIDWREELEEFLQDKGFEVVTAGDRLSSLSALDTESFDVAIIDVNLADEIYNVDGLLITRYIRDKAINTRIVLISARPLSTQELADIYPAVFIEKSDIRSKLNLLLE